MPEGCQRCTHQRAQKWKALRGCLRAGDAADGFFEREVGDGFFHWLRKGNVEHYVEHS